MASRIASKSPPVERSITVSAPYFRQISSFSSSPFISLARLEFLWGAFPFPQIRGKFVEARPSRAGFIENEGPIRDTRLSAVPLPGHFLDMIGVRTPDDVLFLADALFDPAILRKYRFMVMLDVRRGHETLNRIEEERAAWYVPCHAPASQDVRELVKQNREALLWLTEAVWTALSEPASREDVLARIAGDCELEMDAAHLLLNLCSVGAHLTALAEAGRVEPYVEEGRLLWRRTESI